MMKVAGYGTLLLFSMFLAGLPSGLAWLTGCHGMDVLDCKDFRIVRSDTGTVSLVLENIGQDTLLLSAPKMVWVHRDVHCRVYSADGADWSDEILLFPGDLLEVDASCQGFQAAVLPFSFQTMHFTYEYTTQGDSESVFSEGEIRISDYVREGFGGWIKHFGLNAGLYVLFLLIAPIVWLAVFWRKRDSQLYRCAPLAVLGYSLWFAGMWFPGLEGPYEGWKTLFVLLAVLWLISIAILPFTIRRLEKYRKLVKCTLILFGIFILMTIIVYFILS